MESSDSTNPAEGARRLAGDVLRWLGVAGGIAFGFVVFSLLGAGTASADGAAKQPPRSQDGSTHHPDGLLGGLVDHVAATTQAVVADTGLPVRPVLAPIVKPVVTTVTSTVSKVTEPLAGITDPVLAPVAGSSAKTPRSDVPATPAEPAKPAAKHAAAPVEPARAPRPVLDRTVVPGRAAISPDAGGPSAGTAPAPSPSAPIAPSTPDSAPGVLTHSASAGSGGGTAFGVLAEQSTVVGGAPSWRAPPVAVLAPTWCDYFGKHHPS